MTSEYKKPLPNPYNREATSPFWEGAKQHVLKLPRCTKCGQVFFYPREACPACLSTGFDWFQASGKGRLYSYTVIHQPANPAFGAEAPYIFAMVQLDEGPRMVSNLVGCAIEEAKVDMPVVAVYEDITPDWTLVKFKPA